MTLAMTDISTGRMGVKSALLLALWLGAGAVFAANIAGQVELVEGEVKIIGGNGAERAPQVGENVMEGDTLQSGKSGELHLRMQDNGFIAVRPSTKIKIEAYQAKGTDSDSSVFSLLTGTFRSITGWIGKYNRKNYSIKTPTSTIGIRGTDHEPMYIPEPGPGETSETPPGTYDKVNTGATVIENPLGSLEVQPNQVGYAPHKLRPKLLDRVPGAFRPGRNERRIEEKKEHLQKNMEERRQDIRKRHAERDGDAHDGTRRGERGERADEIKERAREAGDARKNEHSNRIRERAGEAGNAREDVHSGKARKRAGERADDMDDARKKAPKHRRPHHRPGAGAASSAGSP